MPREDHLRKGNDVTPLEALMAGSISGAISRAISAPLDTIKIRLQLSTHTFGHRYGAFRALTDIVQKEGVRALWKGNVPAELMYVCYGAAQFGSYSVLGAWMNKLEQNYSVSIGPSMHALVVGSGAGLFSTLTTYPFDLLRTRLAAHKEKNFLSMTETIRNIYEKQGFKGFFAGLAPAATSITATTGLMFWAYELARDVTRKYDNIPFIEGFCGFSAGAIAKGITFPLDTLRKRMQMLCAKSTTKLCSDILKNEGIFGFYKGYGVSMLKTAPTSALSLFFYEYSLRIIRGEDVLES